jgi:predicted pyridoxine 5'-phosphate oxidase superfamily flavin-nucleotide-binding protein
LNPDRGLVYKEVEMAKLSEKAKTLIGEIHPALVATSSKDGKPNVSAKGSLRVLDDEHVVFADVASPRTIANIRENPQVNVICLDAVQRRSCRIWGTAEVINSGKLFDDISREFAARKVNVKNVVKVTVDREETS